LAAADDHRLVGDLRIIALLDGGVERVAIDVRERQRGQRMMANEPRRTALAAASGPEIEIDETVPAKAGWSLWCSGSELRNHLPQPLCELRKQKEHQQIVFANAVPNLKFLRRLPRVPQELQIRRIGYLRGRAHGTLRSQCGSVSAWWAAAMLVGCSWEASANAFTVASSRITKSSTLARKCGSVAAVRRVSGPIPLSARNRPNRSGSPAMKPSA